MPNIDDLIYRLNELEIATTYDLFEGYNQVEIKKEHKPLCAFATECYDVLNKWRLTNASAIFKRMMNEELEDEVDKCFWLWAAGLRLEWEKCIWVEQREVELFGHVITKGGI